MGEHEVRRRAVFLDRDGVLNRPVVRDGRPFPPAQVEEFELYPECRERVRGTQSGRLSSHRRDESTGCGPGNSKPRGSRGDACEIARSASFAGCDRGLFSRGRRSGRAVRMPETKARHASARGRSLCDIDLSQSFLIGDRWRDVDCAHAAGCRAVFIDHGYREALREKPEFTVPSFERRGQHHPPGCSAKPLVGIKGSRLASSPHGLPGPPRFADQNFRRRRGPRRHRRALCQALHQGSDDQSDADAKGRHRRLRKVRS